MGSWSWGRSPVSGILGRNQPGVLPFFQPYGRQPMIKAARTAPPPGARRSGRTLREPYPVSRFLSCRDGVPQWASDWPRPDGRITQPRPSQPAVSSTAWTVAPEDLQVTASREPCTPGRSLPYTDSSGLSPLANDLRFLDRLARVRARPLHLAADVPDLFTKTLAF
jgi:hypothetical protein